MRSRLLQLVSISLAAATCLSGAEWVRGALTLHEVTGEIVLSPLGGDRFVMGSGRVPETMPGLVECAAAHGASAFFSASNRSAILFSGEGSFAIERFEQTVASPGAWERGGREPGQSRVIVNFRSGRIAIDSRRMAEASQYLVETPLGRITVRRALWQMRIEFDPRSGIFDFTITCSDGRVRFTDLQGEQYTLRTGQRLSGAGSRTSPSIEVGEATGRSQEQMRDFRQLLVDRAAVLDDWQAFEPFLSEASQTSSESTATAARRRPSGSDRRPIIIDYAEDPPPVSPFRGEIRAPSADEADLF